MSASYDNRWKGHASSGYALRAALYACGPSRCMLETCQYNSTSPLHNHLQGNASCKYGGPAKLHAACSPILRNQEPPLLRVSTDENQYNRGCASYQASGCEPGECKFGLQDDLTCTPAVSRFGGRCRAAALFDVSAYIHKYDRWWKMYLLIIVVARAKDWSLLTYVCIFYRRILHKCSMISVFRSALITVRVEHPSIATPEAKYILGLLMGKLPITTWPYTILLILIYYYYIYIYIYYIYILYIYYIY